MSDTIDVVLGRLIEDAVAAGRFASRRQVLLAAGLSPGYWNELQARVAKNPDASLTLDTAAALAAVLGCQISELTPHQAAADGDPYEGRLFAIIAARALRYPEAAIQRVLAEDPGYDPGRLWWFRRIEMESEIPISVLKR